MKNFDDDDYSSLDSFLASASFPSEDLRTEDFRSELIRQSADSDRKDHQEMLRKALQSLPIAQQVRRRINLIHGEYPTGVSKINPNLPLLAHLVY